MATKLHPTTQFYLFLALLIGVVIGSGGGFIMFSIVNPNQPARESVTFDIGAHQWGFDPNRIEVKLDDHVVLRFSSNATTEPAYTRHSIIIQAYNISVDLPVGQITVVEFDATIPGEFLGECGIFCGRDHAAMSMTIVVSGSGEDIPEQDLQPLTQLSQGVSAGSWNNSDVMVIVEREARAISFIDGSTNTYLGRLSGIGYQPHTVVFSSNLTYGYIIGRGGWFVKFGLDDFQAKGWIKVGTSSRGTAISNDDNYVLISNYEPSSFVIVDTRTMEIAKDYQIPIPYDENGTTEGSRVASIIDTPNNLMVVAMKDLGEVWVINMSEPNFPVTKIFYGVGEVLHDAFLTEDGRYYFLASQGSNWIWVLDTETLTEVTRIPTGEKPHPGPGALWGDLAFSPSVGEGRLNIWNTTSFTMHRNITHGGPGLFIRSYSRNASYPYVWWDTILSSNPVENRLIHVLDARTIDDPTPLIYDLDAGNGSLHPEFTYNGKYVYVSLWHESKVLVYDAYNFNDGPITSFIITTPTGIFNAGLRVEEVGL
ncbi:MAG: cytochrome D1 domain-containing protein [Candidatus Heimdallarchaeota archaeon]